MKIWAFEFAPDRVMSTAAVINEFELVRTHGPGYCRLYVLTYVFDIDPDPFVIVIVFGDDDLSVHPVTLLVPAATVMVELSAASSHRRQPGILVGDVIGVGRHFHAK
jgi:hypothetical protein